MKIDFLLDGLENSYDLPRFLLDNVATLDHLYRPVDEYKTLVESLQDNVRKFYGKLCSIPLDQIVDKSFLNDNRSDWEVEKFPHFSNSTSGTTSDRFEYRIHQETYDKIEYFEHYIAILREFGILPNKLVYLISDDYDFNSPSMVERIRTQNAVISHGLRDMVEVLRIRKNSLYLSDHYAYFDELFKIFEIEQPSLILMDGFTISEAVGWVKSRGYNSKIAQLLSTTSCKPNYDDLNFLRNNGQIDDWCDHMRCWDGGVTFFTCSSYNTHLVEHFAYPYVDDGRLISKDFFSFPNPFWNYWNGDYASIGADYKVCDCGRLYRDFKISRIRENNVSGVSALNISSSSRQVPGIKRLMIFGNIVKVFTYWSFSVDERREVRRSNPNLKYRFIVE